MEPEELADVAEAADRVGPGTRTDAGVAGAAAAA